MLCLLRSLKKLLYLPLIIFFMTVLYFLSAFICMHIPVNRDQMENKSDSTTIFITSNEVHTDIVVPLRNEEKDWSIFVDPRSTKTGKSTYNYVSFGWGDKGFYLQAKTWADLKLSTAIKAALGLGGSALHVCYYNEMLESDNNRKIVISKATYLQLVKNIEESFVLVNKQTVPIRGVAYWENDCFYEAKGKYSLFRTCNTWTNALLKRSGLKACLWTPFKKGVLRNYPRTKTL